MIIPGDVGWADQNGFIPDWIRFAQKRKYHGSPAALYNHCFLVVGAHGELIQANGNGMGRGNVSDYVGQDVAYRRPPYIGIQQAAAVSAMEELLYDHDQYGWVAIACGALALLTGTKVRFGVKDTLICSGAVSYALTRADIDVGDDSDWNSPADVMQYAIAGNWQVVA